MTASDIHSDVPIRHAASLQGAHGGKRFHDERDTTPPALSVITVVFNCAHTLEKTIQSVLNQPLTGIEYIIIDGGSTDGTLNVLRKYEAALEVWISERDSGIYDAMNKALAFVRGRGHVFLEAGDAYAGDVLTENIKIPGRLPVKYKSELNKRTINAVPRKPSLGMPYCHEGIVYETSGCRFDTTLRIAADYKYYLQHGYQRGLPLCEVSGAVEVDFGTSRRHFWLGYRETNRVIGEFFGPIHQARAYVWNTLKGLTKTVLGPVRS